MNGLIVNTTFGEFAVVSEFGFVAEVQGGKILYPAVLCGIELETVEPSRTWCYSRENLVNRLGEKTVAAIEKDLARHKWAEIEILNGAVEILRKTFFTEASEYSIAVYVSQSIGADFPIVSTVYTTRGAAGDFETTEVLFNSSSRNEAAT